MEAIGQLCSALFGIRSKNPSWVTEKWHCTDLVSFTSSTGKLTKAGSCCSGCGGGGDPADVSPTSLLANEEAAKSRLRLAVGCDEDDDARRKEQRIGIYVVFVVETGRAGAASRPAPRARRFCILADRDRDRDSAENSSSSGWFSLVRLSRRTQRTQKCDLGLTV